MQIPPCVGVFLVVSLGCGSIDAMGQPEPQTLTPGVDVARELSSPQSHSYRLSLEAGEFTVVTVKQRYARPVISVQDPAGRKIFDMRAGEVSIFAEAAGPYLLQVRATAGSYEISVDTPRPARAQDKARAGAERIASEGRQLSVRATTASIRGAIEKFQAARALFRDADHRPGEGFMLVLIGDHHLLLENGTQPGRDHLSQALALAREIGNRPLEAEALLTLGASYSSAASERRQALDYLEQALTSFKAVDDWRGQAVALTRLAQMSNELRNYQEALEYAGQALELANAVDDRAQASRILNNLGLTYQNLGDLPRALQFYKQAIPLSRDGGALRLEFMAVSNMGLVYKELGDYRRALDAYKQSLVLVRKLDNVSGEAQLLNNIGNVYRNEGEIQKSLDFYNQALPLVRRLKLRGIEANVLNNLGAAYALIGEHQKALEHHQQSGEIRKAFGDRAGEASSLNRAGAAFLKLGDLDSAIASLRTSLEIRRQIRDPIGEADTLMNIASVARDRGDLAESRTSIEAALKNVEALRAKISDAGLRATYIARVQETYESYVDVLMRRHAQSPAAGHDAAALQAAERARARVLLESLVEARADIRQGVDASLLEQERALEKKLEAASQRLSRSLSGKSTAAEVASAQKHLEDLSFEHRQLQAEIRKSSPRYAALTQPQPLTAAQIQQDVLDNESVLLEFALGETRSWLWAVTPAAIASIALPPRRDLEAAARSLYADVTARQPRPSESSGAYRRRVAAAESRFRGRAAALSRMLFSGVAEQLHGPWRGKRLVIVAAGALDYLPFASLPIPRVGDRSTAGPTVPLIARHEIVQAPSASVLATLRREAAGRRPARHTVVVLADPVFDAADPRVARTVRRSDSQTSVFRGPTPSNTTEATSYQSTRAMERIDEIRGEGGLARLPFSRDEAAAIEFLAGRHGTLRATDFQATRASVLGAALADYRIVHFATHGLIDAERPELSGLVLSLVNDRGASQDGFLRLTDIFNMRLGADLVVLSACQTALGKEIKGEGLVGLTRGFMYAGAPRVVASLWQVNDLATAELMKKFYTGMLQRRLPPAAALRAAQREMARDPRWAAPYFWAGFILQGDWN